MPVGEGMKNGTIEMPPVLIQVRIITCSWFTPVLGYCPTDWNTEMEAILEL